MKNGDGQTIIVPERDLDLEKLGLINQNLFHVDGELAVRYNRVLFEVFGYECNVDSFRIDKRGISPDLGQFLRERHPDRVESSDNYLTIGSANPYMIILSPEQKSAPLVMPQASYESKFYDGVYLQARHTIEDITSGEAMFGMLENGVTIFRSVEDLLRLRTVRITLDSPRGTAGSVAELNELFDRLGDVDGRAGVYGLVNALNPEYIEKIRKLVDGIGNVETRAVSDIFPIKTEVHCFYSEAFNGVHCLRNFRNSDDVRAIFVTNNQGNVRELGDEILELDLHDPKLLEYLHKYKFMKYDSGLTAQRIEEIEHEVRLQEGVDVVALSAHKKKQMLVQRKRKFPKSLNELSDLAHVFENTTENEAESISTKSYETRLRLSVPSSKAEIIYHMLAELDPSDSVRVYEHNRRKFVLEFSRLPLNRQRYSVYQILKMKGGNN